MSFTFHWPRFSDQFHYDAIQMLNTALNKGNKPPIIADKIEVVELEMGTQPPELEIRDIGDLTMDQFRGIFRLTYAGDAHLVLKTKVQANPLNHKQPDIHLMAGSRGMLAAKQALVVPMLLRLSHFKLSSYVVLVVSKQKGITLVFKTDPLQSVDINSTFDSIAVIQMFIQREIEGQLRQMFREDLPGIIHRLSQQWVKAKVEAPTAGLTQRNLGALNSEPPPRIPASAPSLTRHNVNVFNSGRPPMARTASISRTHVSRRTPPSTPPPAPVNNDGEPVFDPTYGLRPEGIPAKGVFRGFKNLFTPTRGLADLAESEQEQEHESATDDLDTTYDVLEWGDEPEPEYERIPAIGGGTILRPRVYHSHRAPSCREHKRPAPSCRTTRSPPRSPPPSPPPPRAPPRLRRRTRCPSPRPPHPPRPTKSRSPSPRTPSTRSRCSRTRTTPSPRTRAPSRTLPSAAARRGRPSSAAGRARAAREKGGGGAHELSPRSASEFDVGDMDMYFRQMDFDGDAREHPSPSLRPSHMPLRHKVSSLAMSTPG
ncbi:hypothetical protein C8R47DRAFT_1180803 [Mycena vitilis]|nr:hypothetical protein C8R47DRAFT_1180803 [Mycena vitilis]